MASNRNKTGVYSAKDKRPGLFSRLTFGWLSEIVNLGHKQPLEQDHLGRVDDLECTEDLVGRLECGWLTEQQKSDLTEQNPRLWKAVLNVLKPTDYLTIFFLCLLESCSRIFQPVFLSLLLSALQSGTASRQGEWGVVLACGLSACSVIQAFARNHYMRHSLLAAVHIRAALTGLVYKKVTGLPRFNYVAVALTFVSFLFFYPFSCTCSDELVAMRSGVGVWNPWTSSQSLLLSSITEPRAVIQKPPGPGKLTLSVPSSEKVHSHKLFKRNV